MESINIYPCNVAKRIFKMSFHATDGIAFGKGGERDEVY
jgi:hypothetical protein